MYIDTNIIIYHLVDDKVFGEKATRFLEKVAKEEIMGYSSCYTLAETYATLKAFGFKKNKIIKGLEKMLKFGIKFLPLTQEIILKNPEKMKEGHKFGDAIHLSTMEANEIKEIVSEDKHFDETDRKRVKLEDIQLNIEE